MSAGLVLERVTVRYGEHVAITGVSVAFPTASLCALVGPNGSGKSSLVRAIVGAAAYEGSISLPVPTVTGRAAVGWVPQRAAIDWDFPLTVRDVVLQGRAARLGLLGRPGAADRAAVERALAVAGLTALAERPIGRLSGGQQQRTLVARALAQESPVLLLDEPFAGLDTTSERALLAALRTVADNGATVILVHHDLSLVAEACDYVVLLRGRVVASGLPGDVLTSDRIAEAFGVGLRSGVTGKGA